MLRQSRTKFIQRFEKNMIIENRSFKYNKLYKKIYFIHKNMMYRCYKREYPSYKNYGEKGVFVNQSWHDFENFLLDVDKIEGFNVDGILEGKLQLDKDIKVKGNKEYSKDSCMFVSRSLNSGNRISDVCEFVAVSPNLEITYNTNREAFCRKYNLNPSIVWTMMNKDNPKYKNASYFHKGWQFFKKENFCESMIKSKKIIKAINIKTGETIEFSNMSDFSKNKNICYSSIKDCLKGKQYRVGEWTFEKIKEGV